MNNDEIKNHELMEDLLNMMADSDGFDEYVENNNIQNTKAVIQRSENTQELRAMEMQNENHNITNEQEYAKDQENIINSIANNDITHTDLNDVTSIEEINKYPQALTEENQNITIMAMQQDSITLDSQEITQSVESTQNLSQEQEQDLQQDSKEQESTQNVTQEATQDNTQSVESTQNIESNSQDSQFEFNQEESERQMNEMLNSVPIQFDLTHQQLEAGENRLNEFQTSFPLITNAINLSNQIDSMQDDLDNDRDYDDERRNNYDKDKLEKNQRRIDDASEELDKAFDNLSKVRSIADFIRAIYMLNEARHEMKEAVKIASKDDPMIKELQEMQKKGIKQISKELCIKVFKHIKKGYNNLVDNVNTRLQERDINTELVEKQHQYNLAISDTQKNKVANSIKKTIEIASKNYPKCEKRYPVSFRSSRELIEKHEKTFSKKMDTNKALSR